MTTLLGLERIMNEERDEGGGNTYTYTFTYWQGYNEPGQDFGVPGIGPCFAVSGPSDNMLKADDILLIIEEEEL